MNKILVTQGHEKSIGLEVFLKSFLLLSNRSQAQFVLYCYKDSLIETIKNLNLEYFIKDNSLFLNSAKLSIQLLTKSFNSQSFESLRLCIENLEKGDILVTIPTSKSELKSNGVSYTGHTDYFRKEYVKCNPVMLFVSNHLNMALLTEHIPLQKVEESICEDLIFKKIDALINSTYRFNRFFFTGINPHCGENGLLGNSDNELYTIIKKLRDRFPNISFEDPVSGDTFLTSTDKYSARDCLIASHHDQGLAPFKAISGIRASNITIGLPFLRLSPDHGTALELYGKNKANYYGMLFTLNEALRSLDSNGY